MGHATHAKDQCACGPEPAKPAYSSEKERKPRLLSEVLASIVKIPQIDGIPITWIEYLNGPVDCTEADEDVPGSQSDTTDPKEHQKLEEPGAAANVQADEANSTRKPTDVELKERRQRLVEVIREEREKRRKNHVEEMQALRMEKKEARKAAGEFDSDEEVERLEKDKAATEEAAEKEDVEKHTAEKDVAKDMTGEKEAVVNTEIEETGHAEQV
jgi:hypothetical protein